MYHRSLSRQRETGRCRRRGWTTGVAVLTVGTLALSLVACGASGRHGGSPTDASGTRAVLNAAPAANGVSPSPPPLSAAQLTALRGIMEPSVTYPAVPMETRITTGTSTVSGQSPTIQVRVGDSTYQQSWNPAQANSTCPAALWLLPLNRKTLNPVGSANGVVVPICDSGAQQLSAAVGNLGPAGDTAPLVVVNSLLATAGSTATLHPDVVKPMEALGFTNDLAGIDWNNTAVTGIGIPGIPAGQAWSVGGPVGDDGGGAHTTGISLHGTLLINRSKTYGFDSLAAEQASLAQDGTITVAGKTYPNFGWHPGSPGLHLVVVDRANPAGRPLRDGNGVPYDLFFPPSEYKTVLAGTLESLVHRENALILLASSGSAFNGVDTATKTVLAKAVADLGGTPDEIFSLTDDQHYALATVGRSPAYDGVTQVPAITASPARGEADGDLIVQLTLSHRGKWYTPDVGTDSSGSSRSPFEFTQIAAQPPTPWPVGADTGTPDQRKAFLWWQKTLCNCNDLRGQYVDQQAFWDQKLNLGYPANADFTQTAWQQVHDQLSHEYDDYQHAQKFYSELFSLFSSSADTDLILTAAWGKVSGELKKDGIIDLEDQRNNGLPVKILSTIFSFAEALPEVGEAFKIGAAILDTVEKFTETPEGQDYTLDTTVGDLADAIAKQHLAQETMLGDLFNLVFTDWGRMHAVAQAANSDEGPWHWDGNTKGFFDDAVDKSAEASIFHTLLPAVFEEIRTPNGKSDKIVDWQERKNDYGREHVFRHYTDSRQWLAMPSLTDDGRWDLSAIGRKPLSGTVADAAAAPLSTALLTYLQKDAGVYLPDMYRQWPFRTTVINSEGQAPNEHTYHCWNDVFNCFDRGPKTVLNNS